MIKYITLAIITSAIINTAIICAAARAMTPILQQDSIELTDANVGCTDNCTELGGILLTVYE